MILTIDLDDTNPFMDLHKNKEMVAYWGVATDKDKIVEEYGTLFKNLFYKDNIGCLNGLTRSGLVEE